jgi:hypothetical protein
MEEKKPEIPKEPVVQKPYFFITAFGPDVVVAPPEVFEKPRKVKVKTD